jgi:hypothetical protein
VGLGMPGAREPWTVQPDAGAQVREEDALTALPHSCRDVCFSLTCSFRNGKYVYIHRFHHGIYVCIHGVMESCIQPMQFVCIHRVHWVHQCTLCVYPHVPPMHFCVCIHTVHQYNLCVYPHGPPIHFVCIHTFHQYNPCVYPHVPPIHFVCIHTFHQYNPCVYPHVPPIHFVCIHRVHNAITFNPHSPPMQFVCFSHGIYAKLH